MTSHDKPKACPHCGQEGAFDWLGRFIRETSHRTCEGDGKVEVWQKWVQIHCPECGNTFAMLDDKVTREYELTNKEFGHD